MIKVLGSSSRGNCYIISTSKESLILECGIKYKDILAGLDYDLSKVVGCLVTHEHKDHSRSVRELTQNGVDVFMSHGTFDKCLDFKKGSYMNQWRVNLLEAQRLVEIEGFKILPFDVEHDAEEPLGFLIQHEEIGKLLFITDTYYCKYNFKGLNHILVECNYAKELMDGCCIRNRILQSHFELRNVIDFLKSNDLSEVENIMLLHLSSANGDGKYFKEEIEKEIGIPITIAEKGVEIY